MNRIVSKFIKRKIIVIFIFLSGIILFSCVDIYKGKANWKFPNKLENAYLIPIGRRVNSDNGLEITINDVKSAFSVYTDLALGNWIVIPKNENPSNIKIIIKNTNPYLSYKPIDTNNYQVWTQTSTLIDSDSTNIKKVAKKLKKQLNTRDSLASVIQKYIRVNIKHKDYYGHFSKKASETLRNKYGTCVNRARLFVAICRASGIPARTVWGYFYLLTDANIEGHHEWAEYLNDKNQWIALEFDERLYTYHKIIRPYIGHIDLVYSAEENPIFLHAKDYGSVLLYMSKEGNWIKGRFGYKIIENNYPISLTIENNFLIK
jgi:hypothetical protein